jgi:hypothetical protein
MECARDKREGARLLVGEEIGPRVERAKMFVALVKHDGTAFGCWTSRMLIQLSFD